VGRKKYWNAMPPGLPDVFFIQKSQFGYLWEGLRIEDVGIRIVRSQGMFYGHWVNLWSFVSRKIWQPWMPLESIVNFYSAVVVFF
jgi:hypothetical protein